MRVARAAQPLIRIAVPVGHVRSESESVQYFPFDIWTNCTGYKHYKIKVHSLQYGTSVREKINCVLSISIYDSAYTLIIAV